MTPEGLRNLYLDGIAREEGSWVLWRLLDVNQQNAVRALSVVIAGDNIVLAKLLAQFQKESSKMAKLTAAQQKTLDDACRQAFGIDWQAFLAKLEALALTNAGPFIQALIQALLGLVVKQKPKATAKGATCVCCHDVLVDAIQHAGLCAEMCDACQVYG